MRSLTLLLTCCACSAPAFGQLSVALASSNASPLVGTPITFTATATDTNPGALDYQFSVSLSGGPYQTIVDFNSYNTIVWAPSLQEGIYTMQVIARNKAAGESDTSQIPFNVQSQVVGNQGTVTPTANPLVALYSAPPCPIGSSISVVFGTGNSFTETDQRPCNGSVSTNFYIAGMLANTTYQMYSILSNAPPPDSFRPGNNLKIIDRQVAPRDLTGRTVTGSAVTFTTGAIPATLSFAAPTVAIASTAQTDSDQNILLNDSVALNTFAQGLYYFPTATDLNGNVLWYYSAIGTLAQSTDYFIRPVAGGTILLIAADPNTIAVKGQILREIDLAGNTVRETNVTRISEQLAALGMLGINDFDHDAIRLPNGHTIVIGAQEKIFPAGTQGSPGPIDLIGDALVDLDTNLQVAWAWSAYDNLDTNRAAVLGETCLQEQSGCAPLFLATTASDWLHGNSINYNASTGDLYLSMRHQDWIARIDYGFGSGSGKVVWELGQGGSFNFISTDPYPWPSHQHDVEYELQGNSVMSMFDNGNTRAALGTGLTKNSRGMVLQLNEAAMTATPLLLLDTGLQSSAFGSAQRLDNGDYHFDAGFVFVGANQVSFHFESTLAGSQNYSLEMNDISYRSYRIISMYQTDGAGN